LNGADVQQLFEWHRVQKRCKGIHPSRAYFCDSETRKTPLPVDLVAFSVASL